MTLASRGCRWISPRISTLISSQRLTTLVVAEFAGERREMLLDDRVELLDVERLRGDLLDASGNDETADGLR